MKINIKIKEKEKLEEVSYKNIDNYTYIKCTKTFGHSFIKGDYYKIINVDKNKSVFTVVSALSKRATIPFDNWFSNNYIKLSSFYKKNEKN